MKKDTWKTLIQIAISILTAIATTIYKVPTIVLSDFCCIFASVNMKFNLLNILIMMYNVIAYLKDANDKVYTKLVSSSTDLMEAKKSLKSAMKDNMKYPNHVCGFSPSPLKGISYFNDITIVYEIKKVEN